MSGGGLGAVVLVGVLALASCSSTPSPVSDLPSSDAKVVDPAPGNPWTVLRNVDRFPNIETICSPVQDGYRLYVISQTENAKAPPVVVADPKCTTKGPLG